MNEFDDLDRALCALPLEEPPPGLHQGILAATIYRPSLPFKAWETWLIGTLVALTIWLALFFHSAVSGDRIAALAHRAVSSVSELVLGDSAVVLWLAVGVSIVLWVANLDVPAVGFAARRTAR